MALSNYMLTTNQTFPYTEESLSIDFSPRETAADVVAYLALNGVLPAVVTPGGAAVSKPDEYEGDMLIKWNVPQNDADGNPITQVVDGVTVPVTYTITTPWFKKDAAQIDLTIPVGCVLESLDWLEPELQCIPIRWITNNGQKYFPVTHIDAVIDANGNKLSSVIEWCREEVEDYGARMKSMEAKLLKTAVNYGVLSTPTGTTETTGVGYLSSTLLTLYIDDKLHIAADADNPDRKVILVKEDGSVIGTYSLPLDYTLTEDNAFYIYSDTPVDENINYSTTTMVVRAGSGSNVSFVESTAMLTINDNDNMKSYQVAKANTLVKADNTTIKAVTSADGISKTISVVDELQGIIYDKTTGALRHKSLTDSNSPVGRNSVALGDNSQSLNASETALGQYNVSHDNGDATAKTTFYGDADHTALSVGVGLTSTNRINAVEVMQDGTVYIKGVGGYDGKSITTAGLQSLQQVIGGAATVKCYGPFDDIDDALDTLGPADQDLLKAGVHFTVTQADGSLKEYIVLKDNATAAEVLEIGSVVVDDALSDTSENPVQNKVITSALGAILKEFNPAMTYCKGEYVLKDGALYVYQSDDTSAGAWDDSKWDCIEDIATEVYAVKKKTGIIDIAANGSTVICPTGYLTLKSENDGNIIITKNSGIEIVRIDTEDKIVDIFANTNITGDLFQFNGKDVLTAIDLGIVASAYDGTTTYAAGDYCIKGDSVGRYKLYVCNTDITTAEYFDEDKWDEVNLSSLISALASQVSNLEDNECSADEATITKSTDNIYSVKDSGITSSKLASNSVTTAAVSNGAITTAKIADSAVTTAKLADGAATEDKIGGGAVTESKLANGAVTTGKIAADAVITQKIADGAVTTAKIKDDAITAAKIADDAVETDAIKDGAITEDKLSDDIKDVIANAGAADGTTLVKDSATNVMSVKDSGITTAKIADGAVTSTKIAAGSVVTDSVANSAITTAKIADGAVTSTKIAAGSVLTDSVGDAAITSAKLANDAKVGSIAITKETTGVKLDIKDAAGTSLASETITPATTAVYGVVKVDSALSDTSENPIQAKAVKAAIDALDLTAVGGTDKVLTTISQEDGLVSATSVAAVVKETTPTTGSAYTYTIANSTTKVELPLATTAVYGEVKIDEEIKEDATGNVTSTNTPTSKALAEYLAEKLGDLAGAMTYHGIIDSTHTLPTTFTSGSTFVCAEDGTYAGYELAIGHMLIANGDSDKGGTWTAVKPKPKVDNKDVTLSAGTKATIATVDGKDITLTPQAIDSALSDTSENAVQNKVVKDAIDDLQDALDALDLTAVGGTNKIVTTISQEDGLVSATAVDAVVKETTPTTGSLATYTIAGASTKVEIPFDTVVVAAEYKTCTTAGTPTGMAVGEIYLDLTINDKGKTQTATHIYASTGRFESVDVASAFAATPTLPTGHTIATLAQRELYIVDGGAKYPVSVDVASSTLWYTKFDGATSQLSVVSSTF